jgi:isopenicillin-N N-acyltransferase like protein
MRKLSLLVALVLLACGCRRKLGLVEFGVSAPPANTRRGRGLLLGGAQIDLLRRTSRGVERYSISCDRQGRASRDILSGRYLAICRHPAWATQRFTFKVSGRRPQRAAFRLSIPGGGFAIRPQLPEGTRLSTGRYRVYDAKRRRVVDEKFKLPAQADSFSVLGLPRGKKYRLAVSAPGGLPGDLLGLEARAPGKGICHRLKLLSYDYAPKQTGSAYLEMVRGVPVLQVRSEGREAGRAIGKLIGRRVRSLLRYEAEDLLPRRYLPRINKVTRRNRPLIPKHHLEEMAGLAEVSRIDAHELARAHVMVELLQMACTAIAVKGGRAAGGKLLFGRNVDFPVTKGTVRSSLLVVYHSKKRKSFVSVGWPGLTGVVSGMNQDGLCVANLLVMGFSFPRRGTPYLFLIRKALEECSTVEEAAELFRKSKRTLPHNIFVADSKTAAVLECTPGRVRLRRIKGDGPLLCSNSFARKSARYCRRYRRMAQLSGGTRRFDVARISKLLDAVSLRSINIQSMVFVPADMKLHVSMKKAPASAGTFVEIDCRKLLQRSRGQ